MIIKKRLTVLLLICFYLTVFQHANGGSKQIQNSGIAHSIFIAGPDFTGIIDEDGKVVWNSGKNGGRDGYVLPNGNVLICWSDEVLEYDEKKQVIFSFKRSHKENELGTAVRLENGNTLITESGVNPRLMEIAPSGKIALEIALKPETDNIHMQSRMARKLKNGNYLVPHLLAFSVKEYSPSGEVVNIFKTDLAELGGKDAENWPFTAIRLENENTLINLTHGNKTIEVNSGGEVVWNVSNEDFEENPFQDPCGAQRLPNGNTVIASYGAKEGIKLFEITRDKKLVWSYNGYRVHDFQILTTNGVPLEGRPLK